jgi:hypothetical protein
MSKQVNLPYECPNCGHAGDYPATKDEISLSFGFAAEFNCGNSSCLAPLGAIWTDPTAEVVVREVAIERSQND